MKRFGNILYVSQPGESETTAVARAVQLAESNQARLGMIRVIEPVVAGIGMPDGGPISADLQADLQSANQRDLDALADPHRDRISSVKVVTGTPFLEAIREVLRHEYDLVIKLADDRDWLDRLFGSDDMHLLRKCPCPVWLIKPGTAKTYRRILAAVDVHEGYPPEELESRRSLNRQVFELASALALSDMSELHVVHAWDAVGESAMRGAFMSTPEDRIKAYIEQVRRYRQETLDNFMQEVTAQLDQRALEYLKLKTHLVKGSARKQVPAVAKSIDADLVVMGTVARSGIPGFIMGNTAETILNQLDCSVVAIKPAGFVTPVTVES